MPKNQMFVILAETFDSLSQTETEATVEAMKEAGVYALPFPSVDVRIAGDCVSFSSYGPEMDEHLKTGMIIREGDKIGTNYGYGYWMDFKNVSLDHFSYSKAQVIDGHRFLTPRRVPVGEGGWANEFGPNQRERDAVANILIVLLATRNVVKTVEHHKMARLGIGKNKYEYVTTISLPREMEDDEEHPPSGLERSPHLRRGHVRRQHHGPRNSMIKSVFIQPVLVNADRGWVKTRKAYNVSL